MNPKNTPGAGPSKYQTAVDAARAREAGGTSAPADEPGVSVIPMQKGVTAMIQKPSQEQINALMNDDTLEFAPQIHSLKEGEMVEGVLEGKGPSTTFTQFDKVTKTELTREVDTWILANGGVRISILSSVQLDRKLPPFINSHVKIYRGEQRDTRSGQRVTDYLVCGPKKADGKPRSWARTDALDAEGKYIDAPSAPALPAAGATTPPEGGEDRAA